MQLAKRHDIGIEVLQGGSFALLVGFIYHYFGPSAASTPSPEVFGILTVAVILFVAMIKQPNRFKGGAVAPVETLSEEEAQDLTQKLCAANWLQLEKVVTDIYVNLGCAAGRHANTEGENNFSLVIERAGHKTAVMCKPWKKADITSPEIIEFSTALKRAGLSRGALVSPRECTVPALKVAEALGIEVVDQNGLMQLITAAGNRLQKDVLATLHGDRKSCPNCGSDMVLRTATQGVGAGEKFWACTKAPECRCTAPH